MSYQNLAEVYDRFAYDFDYDAWTDWYEKRILDLRPGAREICDVGCGTGPLAVRLAQKGYKVTGIDLSEDMLRVASDKVRAWGVPVRLVRQDMRALLLPRRVDAIVCACDGVNYLTDEKSVQRFLKCAREALKPGGVLAFDISNAGKLREMGRVGLYGEDLENETYLWQNEYDESTSLLMMRLAFFVREGDGRYRKFEETHVQRAHRVEELLRLLTDAGFENIHVFGGDEGESEGPGGQRCYFAATRADRKDETI